MAKLVCQSGPSAGHEYPLNKDVLTMGRQSTCDVQIMDHMSSRQHCQVRRDGKLFTLVDLGSRNGTNLNGKKVGERQLAFGDHIRVGECEWVLVKEPGDVELKDLLTKYEIQDKLGEGGMGVVYKANQKSMARVIALKILSPKYASRQRFVDQFIREARAAGQLNHPNIIQVHDVATENDIHYFSMEFVDGPTCMQLLRANGAFPVPEALEIGRQVAKALEYAHDHRLIHQDIKPDNIMVGANNMVKLADLGISKTFDEAEQDDGPKRVMGTPHYMAPEAALGKKIDHRVDLYSLGATLYHLLTGKTPYTGTSATEVLKAQVMDPMPAIQDINDEVPDDVCALVERLMAKKPDDRYQKASEVADEIKRLQAGLKLGTDRIASSETMILQRLAKGAPTASGPTTPGEGSGHRTGGGTRDATGEASPAEVESHRLRLVSKLCVAALIIFVAIMLLPRFLVAPDPAPATGGGQPITALAPAPAPAPGSPGDPDPTDAGPGTPAPDRVAAHDAAITALEGTLRAEGDRADLSGLAGEVQRILGEEPGAAVRERAERLRTRISVMLADKHRTQLDQAWAKLDGEVEKLVAEKNYEVALARIKAFPSANVKELAPRVTLLRDATTKARDTYLAELRARIKLCSEQKNVTRLTELRNALPPPFLGTPVEQEIVSALAAIDTEAQARYQTLLKDVAADLVRWDATRVEDRHRQTRAAMGDSASGKQFDGFLAAAKQLVELSGALDARLRATGKQRFGGELQKLEKPDLVGASRAGLKVQPAQSSGEVELAWKNLEPDVLKDVIALVLHDEAAKYQPALEALTAARTMAAAK